MKLASFDRLKGPRRPRQACEVPLTREALSEEYRRELVELVALAEITPSFAMRVADDTFEPEIAGRPRLVKECVWQRHIGEQASLARRLSRNRLARLFRSNRS